ncbi:MAG: ankyrin repeat domain-containing protein [Alphaproteobacteria bacterium]|nr:ankyrin repeat domain-containing protein [Alphaproteobacteria bacterium]
MREIDKKLFDAVSGMDTKLVQDLIAAGANIMARSEQNFTPLHHVLMPESAQLLIDSGADVMARTKTGQTPLHCAKTADVAAVLLENGAAINAENKAGKTALWKFI